MSKNTNAKGITLIALVITIIILLILAGVTIGILKNTNILGNAEKAKRIAEIADIKEQIQMDILSKLSEGDGDISDNDLRKILDKYGDLSGEENISDNILTTDKGKYEIKVSDIWGGTVVKEEPKGEVLAKDVLKVNPTATEAKDKSPYVRYNGMDCRVLYNDDTHGLQIITEDSVGDIWVGPMDDSVSDSDFIYNGGATLCYNFLHAAASFNNVVDNLNNKAKSYMDTNGITTDARSLGSISTLNNNYKFQSDTSGMWSGYSEYLKTYDWNGKFKDSDTYNLEDLNQICSLGLTTVKDVWMASRTSGGNEEVASFAVKFTYNNGKTMACAIVSVSSDGTTDIYSEKRGFRPVFLIPSNVVISSGDGSSSNPYILGIK